MMYISQITMLNTLNLYNALCQLYLNITGGKKRKERKKERKEGRKKGRKKERKKEKRKKEKERKKGRKEGIDF